MNDLYGLEASGLPPEMIAQLMGNSRRRAIAEAMLKQSMEMPQAAPVKGRFQGVVSPWEHAAKLVQSVLANQDIRGADAERSAIAGQAESGRKAAMEAYMRRKMGVPGVTPATAVDDEGNAMPSSPGVPADPRGALAAGFADPYLAKSPLLKAEQVALDRSDAREDQQAFLKAQAEAAAAERAARAEADRKAAEDRQRERLASDEKRARENLELRRDIANNRPQEPLVAVMVDGKPTLLPRSQAVGKQPAARGGQAMSATAQKELIQTDEEIAGAQAAMAALGNAKQVSEKAMGGFGSGTLATAGSILPDSLRPEGVDATLNLDNIVTESALPQLKAIFGGMPTEGERKVLLDIQGASSKPHKVRVEIFNRAEAAIKRRMEIAQKKAKQLREGTYFSGDGAAPAAGNSVFDEADAIINGSR